MGPLIGAGIGAGTGQAGWQAIEPFLPQALFGPSEPPKTLPQQFGEVGQETLAGPAYEMGGQVVGRGLQAALAPRAAKVTPQGRQLLQTGEQAGFTPSPADVAPGGMIRRVEALAEKQFGGGAITRAGEKEIEAMRGSPATGVEGWLTRRAREVGTPGAIDASRVSRGETIQAGLQDIARAHRVGEAVEWEFPRMKETGVPDFQIENLREYMRGRVGERADLEQVMQPGTSARKASTGGKITKEGAFVTEKMTRSGVTASSLVKGVAQGEGPITLRQAMTLRKTLGEMYESGDRGPLAAFRQDMDADAGLNPSRAEAWQKARQYTKEWIVPFRGDEPLGRLIDKGEPLAVVQEIMQPRDARINMLRAIHKQTGGQGPVWESVQAEAITQAVETPRILKNTGP
ncbi:MAG TPA: hypothetical protein VI729_09505, partial [Anaerolineales bacterium]|nr:hypothetical protein [Anaerolineales bacterium]